MSARATRLALYCILIAVPAHAEVFQLLDDTKVSGKILHFYDGQFEIELTSGQKVELPTNKIKSITFKLPPPRAEFSTPEKTFIRYKDALLKSDMSKVIECYALMYQGVMSQQIGQASAEELKKMQKEVEGTRFEIKGSKVSGSSATLKVLRQKGDESETADVRLILENGEWKMAQ
jgi:hypothetical protein